jgi:hypothetical protein
MSIFQSIFDITSSFHKCGAQDQWIFNGILFHEQKIYNLVLKIEHLGVNNKNKNSLKLKIIKKIICQKILSLKK